MNSFWDDAARSVLIRIFDNVRMMEPDGTKQLRENLETLIDEYFHETSYNPRVSSLWAIIGADAIEIAASRGTPMDIKHVHATLIRKQRDYGPENIRRFGRQGLMVRMHDKVARLENLLSFDGGGKPENESIEDNLMDVVGYATIGIMWENSTFLLPMRSPAA